MNAHSRILLAGAALSIAGACTTGDKETPADTATGQATSIAPANSVGPVLSAPAESVAPVSGSSPRTGTPTTTTQPKTTTRPKTSETRPPAVPTERDSAFKPKATVDEQGNIQPIKRDTLR